MSPEKMLNILSVASKLKTTWRHCFTDDGRRESVAEHCWRAALWAMLLSGEPEFRHIDMNRVIRMLLIHDLGEAFIGDIPSFYKTVDDSTKEKSAFLSWVESFPEPVRSEWTSLLREMDERKTVESKLYKALDRMEAVLSHDESDVSTWLPLEFELQKEYGWSDVVFSETLKKIRTSLDVLTQKKIDEWNARCEDSES